MSKVLHQAPLRLTVDKHALHNVMRVAERIAGNDTIPILACAKLTAGGGELAVEATDMDVMIRQSIAAEVEFEGVVCAPARRIGSIAATAPDGSQIELRSTDKSLLGRAGHSRFRIPVRYVDEFPAFTEIAGAPFTMDATVFAHGLDSVLPAAAGDDKFQHLRAVHMQGHADGLTFGATDRGRIHRTRIEDCVVDLKPVVLPRMAIDLFKQMFESGPVAIRADEIGISFSQSGKSLRSKVVDGSYPDLDLVLDKHLESATGPYLRLDRADFEAALRRVLPFGAVTDKTYGRGRVVHARYDAGRLGLASRDTDGATAFDTVAAEAEGELGDFAMHSTHVLDAIGAGVAGERLDIAFADQATKLLFRDGRTLRLLTTRREGGFPDEEAIDDENSDHR